MFLYTLNEVINHRGLYCARQRSTHTWTLRDGQPRSSQEKVQTGLNENSWPHIHICWHSCFSFNHISKITLTSVCDSRTQACASRVEYCEALQLVITDCLRHFESQLFLQLQSEEWMGKMRFTHALKNKNTLLCQCRQSHLCSCTFVLQSC